MPLAIENIFLDELASFIVQMNNNPQFSKDMRKVGRCFVTNRPLEESGTEDYVLRLQLKDSSGKPIIETYRFSADGWRILIDKMYPPSRRY